MIAYVMKIEYLKILSPSVLLVLKVTFLKRASNSALIHANLFLTFISTIINRAKHFIYHLLQKKGINNVSVIVCETYKEAIFARYIFEFKSSRKSTFLSDITLYLDWDQANFFSVENRVIAFKPLWNIILINFDSFTSQWTSSKDLLIT